MAKRTTKAKLARDVQQTLQRTFVGGAFAPRAGERKPMRPMPFVPPKSKARKRGK